MAIGSAPNGSPSGDPDVMVEMNTTPLIDVMLVLLIMLIVTIPIQLHAVRLDLLGARAPTATQPDVVRIDIDAQGGVRWNGEAVADRAALQARLAQVASLPVQPELRLRSDGQTPYGAVMAVMANAQRLGLTKIGVVGNERFR
jgi:biopolymer transport protein ExbD